MNRLLLFLLLMVRMQLLSPVCATPAASVLSAGRWVKVQTNQSGIHKITFTTLKSMGFLSPQKVRVFGFPQGALPQMNNSDSPDDLYQYSTWQTRDNLANDCLLIYIPGVVSWRFDPVSGIYLHQLNQFAQGRSILYLTEDVAGEKNVRQTASLPEKPDRTVSEYDHFTFFEEEEYNLIGSGSRWFSSRLNPGATLSRSFKFPGHVGNEPFKVSVAAAGRCDLPSSLSISINSTASGALSFAQYSNFAEADYADLKEQTFSKLSEGDDLAFQFKYNGTSNGLCWLDYIRIQTRCKLNMQSGQLLFCDSRSVGSGNIAEFRLGNAGGGLKIWDISSPLDPVEIGSSAAANLLSFRVYTDSLRRFIAFDPLSDFPSVEKVEEVTIQNLHGLPTPDMLIITTGEFRSEAERLALFHRQNGGMEVAVINVNQIFNEFSGGIPDVTAIRNFVRLLYRKSLTNNSSRLKYLLLFGKGTYDNVHPVTAVNPCYLPTWQSESSLSPVNSFVSDDYFGLMGEDEGGQYGIVDIGIGRIPCTAAAEARVATDKIIHYNSTSTMGNWRNIVGFIGDDEDNNVHVSDSERLAGFVNLNYPAFYTDKIYLDAFREETTPEKRYPGVNKAITNRIKEGALILNYVGHANEEGLAHEKILTISEIDSWSNSDRLPVFVTATCEFSRWDMLNKQSAGEHILFNKVGGGIALFSTTRLVYSSSNYEMNKSFFKYAFEKDKDGNNLRMGDIMRLSKGESGGSINSSKFALVGDPALQIGYPEYRVKTLEINGKPVEQLTDTIKPLSTVTVWGEIQNLKGQKLSGYDGYLYPEVYDKPTEVKTLGNNGQTPFTYSLRNSILFKGNVTVRGGEFTYTFKVPREIDYRIGNGLIRYYSTETGSDANGSFVNFKMGGSPDMVSGDSAGPKVTLYLDKEDFVPGDQVSKAPLLIAFLEDESGIHTAGNGIGHDITAIIDGQTDRMVVLNDYFKSGQDTYKNGQVIFQLPDLADGVHTLKFKAWDLANNSTEAEVRFVVSSALRITKLICWPNPVSEFTDIVSACNRFGEKMSAVIEIFSQQGVKVEHISTETVSSGFATQPIRWNPGAGNHRLSNGVYYYRVTLTTVDGSSDVETGQLILTR